MRVAALCIGICCLLISPTNAHLPEGVVYNLFQWPAGLEPTLDGDLSEWDIVPEDYVVPFDDHCDWRTGKGFDFDESSLSFRNMAAWSQGTNRIYLMQERFDNFWDRNGVGTAGGGDDSWEVMIDSDHSGDVFFFGVAEIEDDEERDLAQGRFSQTAHYRFPPLEPFGWKWFWVSKSTWHDVQPWADYGFRLDGELNSGEATAFIEIETAAWDDFNWQGPEQSTLHTFVEGETMGLGWTVLDIDNSAEDDSGDEGSWGTSCDPEIWKKTTAAADFFLAPIDPRVDFGDATAVEEDSWGRIKSVFLN